MLSLLYRHRQYSNINYSLLSLTSLTSSSYRFFSNNNHNLSNDIIINNNDSDDIKVQKLLLDWPRDHRQRINDMIRMIGEDSNYENIAKGKFISPNNWLQYITTSRRKLVKEPKLIFKDNKSLLIFNDLLERVKEEEDTDNDNEINKNSKKMNLKRYLGKVLIKGSENDLAEEIASLKALCTFSDLRLPHEWYPLARLRKRKIYFHGGPTNSGKTYHALQSLRNADTSKGGGIYCGPLRLLALEVYESLNRHGIYTNLLTGQEKREVDFATHIACTLEMVNITKEYDVAVIDEIQMITDKQRGSAWTRALQGLMAREIHVCGGLEALNVVQSLVESCGDDFEVVKYERLSKLVVSDESLRGDYSKVQPGDCIVAFSRSDIFSIKRQIERLTDYKCAVVYGQLPPETRTMQARLFNEENTGYDILVASDAIGMGLNLNIRRIIFHTVIKRGKNGKQWIEPSAVKQIGGRAGRKSSNYKVGEVTTWQDVDLAYVKAVMSWEIPQIPAAGIFPSIEQIELFSEHLKKNVDNMDSSLDKRREEEDDELLSEIFNDSNDKAVTLSKEEKTTILPIVNNNNNNNNNTKKIVNYDNMRLSKVLDKFVELAQINGRYFLCDHIDLITVANWLHPIPMSLADKFLFSNAPVAIRDHLAMQLLYKFAAVYALGRPVGLNIVLNRYICC